MTSGRAESVVEQAALTWLERPRHSILLGLQIAPRRENGPEVHLMSNAGNAGEPRPCPTRRRAAPQADLPELHVPDIQRFLGRRL